MDGHILIAAEEAFQHSDWIQHFAVSAAVAFAALFPIVDPLGAVPFFMTITQSWEREERRKEGLRSALAFFLILSIFMLGGRFILAFFGVSLSALEAAGGLVVGYTGWRMILGSHAAEEAPTGPSDGGGATLNATRASVYLSPMAIPQLAGPGAMGMALSLASRHDAVLDYAGFIVGVAGIGVVILVLLSMGDRLVGRLSPRALDALTRVLGLVVLTVGVELVFHGIVEHVD